MTNEQLGHWLIERGWMSRESLGRLWPELGAEAGFLEALVGRGHLSQAQADEARQVLGLARGLGVEISGYQILSELGRGGMGVVLLARELKTGQQCIVKVLQSAQPEPESVRRFLREARALEHLDHRNVVKILDIGMHNGRPYFAMEHIEGRDLSEFLKCSEPEFDWVLKVFRELAMGLSECHRLGIIHRDLKPANVIIEEPGHRPVLIDFGLAREDQDAVVMLSQGGELTKSGVVLGTPAYMAPEQLDSSKNVTSKVDVWGFGATLFETLTGRAPYVGASEINIYKQLLSSRPPAVRALRESVPEGLDELCGRCFEPDPLLRPSIDELLASWPELDGVVGGRGTKWLLVLLLFLTLFLTGASLGLVYSLGFWSSPGLAVQPLEVVTNQPTVMVTGRVMAAWPRRVKIKVKGQSAVAVGVNRDGVFRWSWRLRVGANECAILGQDIWGHYSTSRRLSLDYDRAGPKLSMTLPKVTQERRLIWLVEANEELASAFVNDRPMTVQGRRFKAEAVLPLGSSEIIVKAVDLGGTETVDVFRIERRTRLLVAPGVVEEYPDIKPYRRISEALKASSRGETILLCPGVYRECLEIDKDVTLRGFGERDRVIVFGRGESTLTSVARRLTLINLTLKHERRGVRDGRGTSALRVAEGGCRLSQCRILSDSHGVVLGAVNVKSACRAEIEACTFEGIADYAVFAPGASQSFIRDSRFIECRVGVNLYRGQHELNQCVFEAGGSAAVQVYKHSRVSLRSCHFRKHKGIVIDIYDSDTVTIDGCQFKGNNCGQGAKREVPVVCAAAGVLIFKNSRIEDQVGAGFQLEERVNFQCLKSQLVNVFEGVRVGIGSEGRVLLRSVIFRSGGVGMTLGGRGPVLVEDSHFKELDIGFLTQKDRAGELIFRDCRLTKQKEHGFVHSGGSVRMIRCEVLSNGGFGYIRRKNFSTLSLEDCTFEENVLGAFSEK